VLAHEIDERPDAARELLIAPAAFGVPQIGAAAWGEGCRHADT